MFPEFETVPPLHEAIRAIAILLVSFLAGWLIFLGMRYASKKIAVRAKFKLAHQLLSSLSLPILILIAVEGLMISIISISNLEQWLTIIEKANTVFFISITTYCLSLVASSFFYWHLHNIGVHRKSIDEGLSLFIRRGIILIVYIIGLVVILKYFGISINAIIATLGIGGIALALALQSTLSNFFAGTQLITDRIIHTNDFIELDNGVSGYVVDVGWRSTKILTLQNNIVTIPNSKLADSIITNYQFPQQEVAVMVELGVSYSSDLDNVQAVATEVAQEVINELPEAIKTREPWFWYKEVGESNINFGIWIYAVDRIASFGLKTELIKRLHKRFKQEGIQINYPTRQIISKGTVCELNGTPVIEDGDKNNN
jgi:small-conductance mechanosensitive channel